MIISKHYYYGLPKSQVNNLEGVAQATLNEYLKLCKEIIDLQKEDRMYGDADYEILKPKTITDDFGESATIIKIDDFSASWWAEIRIIKPYEKQSIDDFWIFAAQGKRPSKLDWDSDWTKLNPDIYIKARRMSSIESWGCPFHILDFKHPLLKCLDDAIEYELKKK